MIVIDIDPVLLYIGGSPLIRWYGVMFVVGILVGVTVAIKLGEEKGLSEDDFWTIFWPATIVGLIGSRLYFVFQQPDLSSYFAQPWRILATWEGGLAFYGAIFGAALAILVVCHLKRISLWTVLDVGAIFAVVGQTFGRIGNMINGDVRGYPTDLPWGFIYAHPNSFVAEEEKALQLHGTMPFPIGVISPDVAQSMDLTAFQPAAVYEFFFNILLFVFLWRIRTRVKTEGLLFVIWLIVYSLGQILIFTQRMNDILLFGLKQAQLTAIVVIIACIPLALYLRGRRSSEGDVEPEEGDGDDQGPPGEARLPGSGGA